MFQYPSLRFISDTSLYLTGTSSLRGLLTLGDLLPLADTERFYQPPVLVYEMDFFEASQTLVLGLN